MIQWQLFSSVTVIGHSVKWSESFENVHFYFFLPNPFLKLGFTTSAEPDETQQAKWAVWHKDTECV